MAVGLHAADVSVGLGLLQVLPTKATSSPASNVRHLLRSQDMASSNETKYLIVASLNTRQLCISPAIGLAALLPQRHLAVAVQGEYISSAVLTNTGPYRCNHNS